MDHSWFMEIPEQNGWSFQSSMVGFPILPMEQSLVQMDVLGVT